MIIPFGFINDTNSTYSIVTANLWLNLDAGNPASYPGTGTTWYDLSGAGRDFTSYGTSIYVSSPIKCFYEPGFTRSTNFSGDDFTIQAWINTTQAGTSGTGPLAVLASVSRGSENFSFGIGENTKLTFLTGPLNSALRVSTNASVNTGQWLNVAVTRTKSTGEIKLYVNGVLDTTGTAASGTTLTGTGLLNMGSGNGVPIWIGGFLNNVLSYTAVLSDADILQNYNAQYSTYYG